MRWYLTCSLLLSSHFLPMLLLKPVFSLIQTLSTASDRCYPLNSYKLFTKYKIFRKQPLSTDSFEPVLVVRTATSIRKHNHMTG